MADILGTKFKNDVVTVVKKVPTWTTFEGVKKPISEIDHQHLSNIMYFIKYINPQFYDTRIRMMIGGEIDKRFDGKLLPYRPLARNFSEIDTLIKNGWLKSGWNGEKQSTLIIIDGKEIGEVV